MFDGGKCLFYPYSDKTFGLVKGLLFKWKDIDVVASAGTGFVNKDISYAVNRNKMNKIVKSIEEIEFKNYDELIISSHINYKLCENEIIALINKCIKEGLNIVYLGTDSDIKNLLELCNKYSSINAKNIKKIKTTVKRFNELNLSLYTPKTPIVYIGGLLETIDSFDIGLQIKLRMEELGYNVSLISKEIDGKIFNTIDYPEKFMKDNELVEKQILAVNRWVRAIDYVEKPDLILIDVPKGMMQYSNSFHNTFGIYTYMIAQAIPPDYLIVTGYPSIINKEYVDEIDQYFKETIKKGIDVINVTNAKYDIGIENIDTIDKPLYIPEKVIDELILENKTNFDFILANLNKKKNINLVINNIIQKFS